MSIKVGVVGGGRFGLMHLRAFDQLRREGRVESIALAEINGELLQERCTEFGVAGYADYFEMLQREELDAVTVVTPDFLHRQIALDCIAAGKHVLVEKPLDTSTEGCGQIVRAAERAGVMVQVDFHKRFDPYHTELHDAIAQGELGVPEYGYAWVEDSIEVPRDWFPHWVAQSSPAWFLGVHMVDLFRWFIGGRNGRRVWATASKCKLASLGIDTYDSVQALIEFEDSVSFHLDASWIMPEGFEALVNQGIRIVGSEGVGEVDSQDRGARLATTTGGQRTVNPSFFLQQPGRGGIRYSGYGVDAIADFADNVQLLKTGRKLDEKCGRSAYARDGLEVTRITEGIHRSIETGEIVEL
jgi:predicted dehydrogenase